MSNQTYYVPLTHSYRGSRISGGPLIRGGPDSDNSPLQTLTNTWPELWGETLSLPTWGHGDLLGCLCQGSLLMWGTRGLVWSSVDSTSRCPPTTSVGQTLISQSFIDERFINEIYSQVRWQCIPVWCLNKDGVGQHVSPFTYPITSLPIHTKISHPHSFWNGRRFGSYIHPDRKISSPILCSQILLSQQCPGVRI